MEADPDFDFSSSSDFDFDAGDSEPEGESEKIGFPMMQPHPLLVDHIIERILDYTSLENLPQLLDLRLVCTHWNYYATKILRKKFYLSFGGHKYNVGRLKTFLDELDARESLENVKFPVTRFRLFSDLFQECNKETVLNFIRKCGPTAESLVIFKDINSDIEYTSEELDTFDFPRLTELSFSDRRRSSSSHDTINIQCQSFLFKVVSSSKNHLTTLSIKFPREPIYEIYEKEDLVIKVFQQCHLPHLHSLKLDMSITDKVLRTLADLPLKIKTLHLSLGASVFTPEALKSLLHKLRFSLEDLRLTDLYRRASLTVDLPRLDNLQNFEIHGLELPAYFISFPDFTYGGKMPNLRKLRLNTWAPVKSWEVFVPEWENDEEKAKIQGVVSCIEDLSLAMNFDCPIALRRISTLFQGLSKLEMHFSRGAAGALQTVFEFMPQLEELKLNQSYLGEIATNCIDDVLTGLGMDECKGILKKKSYKEINLEVMEKRPSLVDLKNLRKFDMLGLRHRNIITDVTAYLVLLKLKHLCVLDIGRSELSDSCLKDLALRFPNGKFRRYLSKKRMKSYDQGLYKNSVFTSICAVQ